MSRTVYRMVDGELTEVYSSARSNAAPYVHRDSMDPIVSMADGKTYDSKSLYRAGLRAAGCVEVGNDAAASRWQGMKEPGDPGRDIKRAIEQLRAR